MYEIMEYGFTEEGNKLLDEARIRNEQRVQEALRLQEESETQELGPAFGEPLGQFMGQPQAQPDMPEQQLEAPEMQAETPVPEPQYTVTAYETVQHVHDNEPGLAGEFTAGMTYDPVEVKYDVKKAPAGSSGKNYDRFTAEPAKSELEAFDEMLNAEAQAYQEKENSDFDRDMRDSPLYKRSSFNRYG